MQESILFVDDEPNLLMALQRMLRPKRKEWEMSFVGSAKEGLELMTRRCFDVVVADMRMPEMDGAEFLKEVKHICPRSIRIVLSGQADLNTIAQSIRSTHQYLAKPCDPDALIAAINRASYLRRLTKNDAVGEFASQLSRIPSQPDLYDRLIAQLHEENPSIAVLSEIISKDIGMAAKALQLVNSAFFGVKREVYSIHEAVKILGVDLLRRLAVTEDVFERCDSGQIGPISLRELNHRCVSIGNFAMKIAMVERMPFDEVRTFPTAGLLHNVGEIVLALFDPHRFECVLKKERDGASRVAMETELFGTSHAKVGGYLLGLWGLPTMIVNAAAFHHSTVLLGRESFNVLTTVQLADLLATSTEFAGCERLDVLENSESYRRLAETLRTPRQEIVGEVKLT